VTDLSRHILQTTVSWFHSITTFLPMSNPYQAFEDFLASIGVPVTDANRDAFAAFYQQQNAGHAQDPSHSSPFDINAFAQAFASAIPQPIPIDYSALSQALITGQRASQASEVPMEKMQPWGGDRDKLDEFISQCELRFFAKPFKYATAEAQILFASGVLVDTPRKLVDQERSLAPPLQSPWLHSWPAFTGQLRAWFGDADPRATARNKLSALRQTTSVLGYWTDFAVLAVKLPWGDEAKKDAFYVGLKPEIKDELARLPVSPVSLLNLKEHAVRIDTRLYQRHFERRTRTATSILSRTVATRTLQLSTQSLPITRIMRPPASLSLTNIRLLASTQARNPWMSTPYSKAKSHLRKKTVADDSACAPTMAAPNLATARN
jgi:hypothetical protein